MSFKNPIVPLIENPTGIDRPIQEMQQFIADLGWLEKSFGRCYNSYRMENGRKLVYPEVWQGKDKDLLQVLPNDNLKSQSFFKTEEPIKCIDFQPGNYSAMQGVVSLIVWFNLTEIDRDLDYRYMEILQAQVQRKIEMMIFSQNASVKILNIWSSPEQVFKGYNLNDSPEECFKHPFGGFRFENELTYIEDCPDADLL